MLFQCIIFRFSNYIVYYKSLLKIMLQIKKVDLEKENRYWESYYNKNPDPISPSDFAKFVLKSIDDLKGSFIDLGCGNGRDAVFFNKKGINVTGVDLVCAEIDYLNANYANETLRFVCDDFTNLPKIDAKYLYSRFTMHSIVEKQEDQLLKWVTANLNSNGLFFIEARSIKDEKLKKGEKISKVENIADKHYRRYMDLKRFKKKLGHNNLKVIYEVESTGLAIYKDEDPVIIRLVISKEINDEKCS